MGPSLLSPAFGIPCSLSPREYLQTSLLCWDHSQNTQGAYISYFLVPVTKRAERKQLTGEGSVLLLSLRSCITSQKQRHNDRSCRLGVTLHRHPLLQSMNRKWAQVVKPQA